MTEEPEAAQQQEAMAAGGCPVQAFLGFPPPAGQAEAIAQALPDLFDLMQLVRGADPQ